MPSKAKPKLTAKPAKTFELVIPEPLFWFSQLDERQFYHGLQFLPEVESLKTYPGKPFEGIPNEIVLQLNRRYLSDGSLHNLIGLMARYSVDMQSLLPQLAPKSRKWIKDYFAYRPGPVLNKKPVRSATSRRNGK